MICDLEVRMRLNKVQRAAYELIQSDARFLYTLVDMSQNASNISSNYIMMCQPYIGIFADGAEQWCKKLGLKAPLFNEQEKNYYDALRQSHKLLEKTYSEYANLLMSKLAESDQYQEMYLNNAQALLGDAFDYAINACGIAGDSFMELFSVSSVSNRIENGEAAYIMGKSGIEAAVDVLVETTGKAPTVKPKANFNRSREYWIGWAVAYYQWFSGRKFSDIFKVLSFEDLERMYAPLHEADISKFADIADAKVREYFADTNLKRIRTLYGCTQAELARRSNVSLRSIQMYEQRNKDINKASAETVLSLAKVLGCTMEDLLEK